MGQHHSSSLPQCSSSSSRCLDTSRSAGSTLRPSLGACRGGSSNRNLWVPDRRRCTRPPRSFLLLRAHSSGTAVPIHLVLPSTQRPTHRQPPRTTASTTRLSVPVAGRPTAAAAVSATTRHRQPRRPPATTRTRGRRRRPTARTG
jgi:hypothetical protein